MLALSFLIRCRRSWLHATLAQMPYFWPNIFLPILLLHEKSGLTFSASPMRKKGTPCESYASGRIFQEDRELRWEKQRDVLRVVYLGPAESTIALALHEYRLKDRQKELDKLTKSTEPTWYSLFGERLKSEDLPYFGKTARPGDFAVVRIPRILRYPVPQDDKPSARLLVCEYRNKATDSVELFRFQAVKTWNDKKHGVSA